MRWPILTLIQINDPKFALEHAHRFVTVGP
jgi:hypothetical protein